MKTKHLNHINILKDKTHLNYEKVDKDLGQIHKTEVIETPFQITEHYCNDAEPVDWTCITLHKEIAKIFPEIKRIEIYFKNWTIDELVINTIIIHTKNYSIRYDEITKDGKVKNMLDCSLTRRIL